ncbi:gastrula zinc finger protein XlCGF26.1-like [Chironomus tepperi]|uniref:gastrula zinc finger protein XlCGF26.1-like n=1 Tax=Chironomus tepperi TaxID=113505 RepID=UPI00391EFF0C
MYSFSNWCFLCARDNFVDISIQSLPVKMQEKIGEYSLVNYNLPGCPKNICSKCHKFLIDVERYTKRYESVEKCLMELMRNKNADIRDIKSKYDLNEDLDELDDNEVIVQIVDNREIQPLVETESFDNPIEIIQEKFPEKQSIRILNPTLPPKIESKIRLNLLTCDKCGHNTSTVNLMKSHMDLHLKNEKLYKCNICRKRFSNKKLLANHESIHTSSTERKTFECKECGKFLSSQTAVNNHVKWFHMDRQFSCTSCHKKFATKGSLTEHMKIHSNVKQHVCPICNKEYKTASTLTNHIDTHSVTEYKCAICDLKLNSRRTLKQHEKVHSNLILHTCEICGAEFKRTKTYKEHLIIHSDIRPYKCDFCPKVFKNGPNCRKHKREVHPTELAASDKTESNRKSVNLPKINELLNMSVSGFKTE